MLPPLVTVSAGIRHEPSGYRSRNSIRQKAREGERCRTFASNLPNRRENNEIRLDRIHVKFEAKEREMARCADRYPDNARREVARKLYVRTWVLHVRISSHPDASICYVRIFHDGQHRVFVVIVVVVSSFNTPQATVQARNAKDSYSIIIPFVYAFDATFTAQNTRINHQS